MRAELEKFCHYSILNTEKMTPRFLSLTKNNKKSISLDRIRDTDGTAFVSDQQQHNHIYNFYRNIYIKPEGNILHENCIERYLGDEICNNEIVRNSKLTDEERDFFDSQLSLQELDTAAYSINTNSAGGLDGIGGKFIKKYWAFLRNPLWKYANFGFENGTLTQSFNSAGIRLIPKKGEIEKIKNWRPISLLNCIYKVIAKALDNRLKKINEIVLSRAQKGFMSNRQIQECIINIVETIALCENNKIPGFILALDMAKAFDTVRHDYMNLVYKFFNVGAWLTNALNTISTG
jgi:hypothetical protein